MNKYNYINHFPKPFLKDLIENKCIPIIGAGFSKNGDIPPGKKMLNWDELGRAFATDIPDYSYTNAIDAISAYAHEYSRVSLIEKLRELLLVNSVKSGKTHKAFCALQFDIVCTTNLEFLLEHGYSAVNIPFYPIINEDQLSISNSKGSVQILKLHGDLNHPNRLVVTEEDYDSFLVSNPMIATYLSNLLITRTPLFIGYSLDDSDFRQIWQVIKNRLGKLSRQAYVIKVECPPHEKAHFERRGVKVINIPGVQSEYPIILEKIFEELRQYWHENTLVPTPSSESTQVEIALPNEASNRLCFFSSSYQYLHLYKRYLFPIAIKYGLVPVIIEDVFSVGENWMAKTSALIDKSKFAVIDVDSKNTLLELGMFINLKGSSDNLLIVDSKKVDIPYGVQHAQKIHRSQEVFDEFGDFSALKNFMSEAEQWFSQKSESMKTIYEEEPKRLLEKDEYRAAVISSVTLLEIQLRSKIDNSSCTDKCYPMRTIYSTAHEDGILNLSQFNRIRRWVAVRNKLVHTELIITKHEAKVIVTGIYGILESIKEN